MKPFVYLTGRSPRALLQRLRLWLAYRRPVTFHNPDPAAKAAFDEVVSQAERPVRHESDSDVPNCPAGSLSWHQPDLHVRPGDRVAEG